MRRIRPAVRAALALLAFTACQDSTPTPLQPSAESRSSGSGGGDRFTVDLKLVAEGLVSPLTLVPAPDRTGRLFVADQAGQIRIITRDGTMLPQPFLDLRARLVPLSPGYDERGLLGLAFHPQYARNGRFFVYYSAPLRAGAPAGYNHTGVIAEYRVSADPNTADPGSEQVVLQVDEPQSNHNGGTIAFGPDDGYLYISLGDGGGANDNNPIGHVEDWYADNGGGNGQDLKQNLLGSILRLDVDRGRPYAIPRDNPFVGRPGLDEVYAYGFRNPYRFSFDMESGHDLLVGDAGQERWEEVSRVRKGGNYGWNVKEGTHCFDAENPRVDAPRCPDRDPVTGAELTDPVIEYANAKPNNGQVGGLGIAVVAGYVYRGLAIPHLRGQYIFGDFSRSFRPGDGSVFVSSGSKGGRGGLWSIQPLTIADRSGGRLGEYVKGFGQDLAGEVYLLASSESGPTGVTGKVYKLTSPRGNDRRD